MHYQARYSDEMLLLNSTNLLYTRRSTLTDYTSSETAKLWVFCPKDKGLDRDVLTNMLKERHHPSHSLRYNPLVSFDLHNLTYKISWVTHPRAATCWLVTWVATPPHPRNWVDGMMARVTGAGVAFCAPLFTIIAQEFEGATIYVRIPEGHSRTASPMALSLGPRASP